MFKIRFKKGMFRWLSVKVAYHNMIICIGKRRIILSLEHCA